MLDLNWLEIHKADVEIASSMMLQQQRIEPLFIAYTADRSMLVHQPTWDNAEEQYHELQILRATLIAYDCVALSSMSEVWTRCVVRREGETSADLHKRGLAVSPSDCPDRQENISVTMCWRTDDGLTSVVTTRELMRNTSRRIVGLADPQVLQGGLTGFPFDLLPDRAPSRRQREMMKDFLASQVSVQFLEMRGHMPQTFHAPGHA